jgi:hypothetical protein
MTVHNKYIPEKLEFGYYKFIIETSSCPLCSLNMIKLVDGSPFPTYRELTFQEQCKRAGIVLESNACVDNKYICQSCADAGKANFTCAKCNESKPSYKVQESIGYPEEYLCKDCYATVSAKKWDETIEKLREDHKYDWNV